MSAELAAEVVENDLGKPPSELFAEWDPVPIAAASVGQVHRAITHDGLAVAVKVQYPAAADALTADLDNIGSFLEMILSAPTDEDAPTPADLAPLLTEFRARVAEEVDYRNEAGNQRLFASYFAGHPFITIPAVVDDLSGDAVLTTELVEGVRFAELETWSQGERDLAGETVFRFVQHSVFRLGAYNGDPHPGNYLFSSGGRVAFLDFGLVKRVDGATTELLAAVFAKGFAEAEPAEFSAAMRRAGFLKPDVEVDDAVVVDLVARPWLAVIADETGPMPFPKTDMGRPSEQSEDEKALARAFNLPPEFVILMRTLVGMQALLARIGARAHWRAIANQVWPFVGGAPTTALGDEEARWLRARR
jgi:predicted unusual protein kinase regulating ubiquinone biosynthesis (AarF/ABC1/UbiB family)